MNVARTKVDLRVELSRPAPGNIYSPTWARCTGATCRCSTPRGRAAMWSS